MDKKHRLEGFNALLADHQNSSLYFEDPDGSWQQWGELSAEGKLGYIARDAASWDVPFERFAYAVRDVLGNQAVAAREEASLRLLLRHARELRGLETLLPSDERTESTPLVERFKEMLDGSQEPAETAAGAAEQFQKVLPGDLNLEPAPAPGEPDARERLVETIYSDFFVLEQQAHLAGKEVSRAVLAANISRVERQVVKLADALFTAGGQSAVKAAGYESLFLNDQKAVSREDRGIER